jgi:DNA recombination protein RmuC
VHKLGRELYQRLSTMGGHIDKLGRSLNTVVGDYNKTVSSIESRVLVTARRMADLKVVEPGEQIEAPRQVNEVPRSAQAPELVEQRLVALPKNRAVPVGQGELPAADDPTGARATS